MKEVKLSKIERAILALAKHVEYCPSNEYKVYREIMDILGYEEATEMNGTVLENDHER